MKAKKFGGEQPNALKTYDPARDSERLRTQVGRVYECLSDGQLWTLHQLYAQCHRLREDNGYDSPAGISARIRDLRKPIFGAHNVKSINATDGQWRYRIILG